MANHAFNNNAIAHLQTGIDASAVTLTLTPGGAVKLLGGWLSGKVLYLTLTNEARNIEVVKVTDIDGDVLTVTRGVDGSSSQIWYAGTAVIDRVVAADLTNCTQKDFRTTTVNPNNNAVTPDYAGEKILQTGLNACENRWWKNVPSTSLWRLMAGTMCDWEKTDDNGYVYSPEDIVVLLHCLGPSILDTGWGHTMTEEGDGAFDTAVYKFGGSSYYYNAKDGNGGYITTPSALDGHLQFATTITCDAWVNFANPDNEVGCSFLIAQWPFNDANDYKYQLLITTGAVGAGVTDYTVYLYETDQAVTLLTYSDTWVDDGSTWKHFEFTRDASDNIYLFVNGTLQDSAAGLAEIIGNDDDTQLSIFGAGGAPFGADKGQWRFDELRLSHVNYHTANFTPPVTEYTGFLD